MNIKKIIFLADDDSDDRMFFREAVSEIGTSSLVEFESGTAIMDYLNQEAVSLPYVIFLDLNMPRLSGMEVLKQIRDRPALCDIPVVIYSTASSHRFIDEAFECGANLYFVKPTDFGKLKEAIRQVLSMDFSQKIDRNGFLVHI